MTVNEHAATITALRDRVAELERDIEDAQSEGYRMGREYAESRATAAEAAIARLRDEVIEECVRVADDRQKAWLDVAEARAKAPLPLPTAFQTERAGEAEFIAAALRALKDTHHETR